MIYLQNEILKLDIDENASQYSHTRFDHAGQILQVYLKNTQSFLTTETKNPLTRIIEGTGLCGEFGINMPVGYDECPVGDYFPKIGVGLLQKQKETPYDFFYIYPLIKDKKTFLTENNHTLQINSLLEPHRGFGYEYEKKIMLKHNQVTIAYRLKNIGAKRIITTEYCHNFIGFNNLDLDSHYNLDFDIEIHKESFKKFVNPHGCISLGQNSISWNSKPTEDFFIENLGIIKKWKLQNSLTNTALSEEVSFTPSFCNIWGNAHVVSPEIFISIDIAPLQTMTWERVYTFEEM